MTLDEGPSTVVYIFNQVITSDLKYI